MNSGELHRKVMGSALNPVTRRLKSIHTAKVTAESHINVGIRKGPAHRVERESWVHGSEQPLLFRLVAIIWGISGEGFLRNGWKVAARTTKAVDEKARHNGKVSFHEPEAVGGSKPSELRNYQCI